MSQESNQLLKSFEAYDSLPAYRIVAPLSTTTVDYVRVVRWGTTTGYMIGTSWGEASVSGVAVPVVVAGSGRVACGASVSSGSLITGTTTGFAIEAVNVLNTTTTVIPRCLGVGLQVGDTNSVIEVLIQPLHLRVAFA